MKTDNSQHYAHGGRIPRPAKVMCAESPPVSPLNATRGRALIVDLNNFASFPTLAVGILIGALRNAGYQVDVICPLAYDVPASQRERQETLYDHVARRANLSTWRPFRMARDAARLTRLWWVYRPHARVLRETAKSLCERPDVILLSAYLQHYQTVCEIGKLAKTLGIPMIVGGPVFNMLGTAHAWRHIPGLTAIVGGEVDLVLPDIVNRVIHHQDLLKVNGVVLPDGRIADPAPPLKNLDAVPLPDFSDFPWDRYKFRVIPLMTGRGCQWARCTFCSDVWSASGRTFRTRSVESVLHEAREQSRRHQTSNFVFLDIKLNSNPAMLRGIVANIQHYVHGAQWIGTVHVDQRKDNGLTRRELKEAVGAGMRRVSFGLESGSQRMLDLMDKGCTVEANSEFIRNAYEAGLSIRCTMFKGYPGETSEDLEKTADFLEHHGQYIDRIRFNEFSVHEGTPIYTTLASEPSAFPQIVVSNWDHRNGRAKYISTSTGERSYRRAKAKVLRAVFAINRRSVRSAAQAFDGLM